MLIACGRVGFDTTRGDVTETDALAFRCGCGDADGNGVADLADVTAVAQQLSGIAAVACAEGADANLDGAITRRDQHHHPDMRWCSGSAVASARSARRAR